jgi:hypothetical protein
VSLVKDWWPGDLFEAGEGRKLRIVAQIPVELAQEHVDRPLYEVWTVEPA